MSTVIKRIYDDDMMLSVTQLHRC